MGKVGLLDSGEDEFLEEGKGGVADILAVEDDL
jgi:hypothetical protein